MKPFLDTETMQTVDIHPKKDENMLAMLNLRVHIKLIMTDITMTQNKSDIDIIFCILMFPFRKC